MPVFENEDVFYCGSAVSLMEVETLSLYMNYIYHISYMYYKCI